MEDYVLGGELAGIGLLRLGSEIVTWKDGIVLTVMATPLGSETFDSGGEITCMLMRKSQFELV